MGSSTKCPPWNVGILRSLTFIGLFCSLILCSEALLNSYLKADMKVQLVPLSQALKGGSAGEGFQRKINSHHYLSRTSYGKNHHVSPAEYKAHLKSLAQGLGIRVHVYGGKKPHPHGSKEWKLKNSLEHSPKLHHIEDEIIKKYTKKKKGSIKIVRGNNGHDDTAEDHEEDDKRYTTTKFTKYSTDFEKDDDHRPKPKDGYRQEEFRSEHEHEDGHDDEPAFRRETYKSSSPRDNKNKRPRFKDIELSAVKGKRESDEGPDCIEFERGLLHCKPGNSKNELDSFEVYVRKYKERDRNLYKDRSELKQTKSQFKKGSSSKSPKDLYEDYEGPSPSYSGDPELRFQSFPSGEGRDGSGYRYSYGKESSPEFVTKGFRYFSESPKTLEGFSRYPEKSPGAFYSKEGLRYLPPKEYPPLGSIGVPVFNPQREFSPDSKIPPGYQLAEYPVGISGPYQQYPSSGIRDYPPPRPPQTPHLPHEINDSPPKSPGDLEGVKYPLDPYPLPGYYGNVPGNPYSTTDTPTINYNSRPMDHPEHEKGPYPLQSPYPSQQQPPRAYQPTGDSPATIYPSSSPQEIPQYSIPKSPYPQPNLDDSNPHVGQSGSSQKVVVTGPSEKGFDIVYHHNYNLPQPPRPISAPPTLSSSIPTTPPPAIATNTSQFASLYPRKARFTNPLDSQWVGIHSSDALMDMRNSVPLIPTQGITTEGSDIITAPNQMETAVSSSTAPTTSPSEELPTQIEGSSSSNSSSNSSDTMSSSSSNVVNVIYVAKNQTYASTSVSKDLILGKVGIVEDADLELPSQTATNATSTNESPVNLIMKRTGIVEDVDLDPTDVELTSQATTTRTTSKPHLNLNMSSGKKFISLASSE